MFGKETLQKSFLEALQKRKNEPLEPFLKRFQETFPGLSGNAIIFYKLGWQINAANYFEEKSSQNCQAIPIFMNMIVL